MNPTVKQATSRIVALLVLLAMPSLAFATSSPIPDPTEPVCPEGTSEDTLQNEQICCAPGPDGADYCAPPDYWDPSENCTIGDTRSKYFYTILHSSCTSETCYGEGNEVRYLRLLRKTINHEKCEVSVALSSSVAGSDSALSRVSSIIVPIPRGTWQRDCEEDYWVKYKCKFISDECSRETRTGVEEWLISVYDGTELDDFGSNSNCG